MFCDYLIRVLFDLGSSHYFYQKNLMILSLLIFMGLMTSLRIANAVGGSATLNLLFIDVEIILCDFSFRANFYLCFGMDFCKDWLNYYEAISFVPCGLFIFNIFNLLSRFLFFLCDFDSNLMALFYSLSSHDEESVISLIHVV